MNNRRASSPEHPTFMNDDTAEQLRLFPLIADADNIYEFQEEFRYLSNMWILDNPIETDSGPVPTSEHAYQMAKFSSPEIRAAIAATPSGTAAKKLARKFEQEGAEVSQRWLEHKEEIMQGVVLEKFTRNPGLMDKLVATGSMHIEEGNRWKDTYWGVSPPITGKGENRLGQILMNVRDALIAGEHPEHAQMLGECAVYSQFDILNNES